MEGSPEVFPFKYFDEIRGRWIQARYKAAREDIELRYAKWEIAGPAEHREGAGGQVEPPIALKHCIHVIGFAEPERLHLIRLDVDDAASAGVDGSAYFNHQVAPDCLRSFARGRDTVYGACVARIILAHRAYDHKELAG